VIQGFFHAFSEDSPTVMPSASLKSTRTTVVPSTSTKPAKMGTDYIFWIPRVYVRNGLVDPGAEYEIYLRKAPKEKSKD